MYSFSNGVSWLKNKLLADKLDCTQANAHVTASIMITKWIPEEIGLRRKEEGTTKWMNECYGFLGSPWRITEIHAIFFFELECRHFQGLKHRRWNDSICIDKTTTLFVLLLLPGSMNIVWLLLLEIFHVRIQVTDLSGKRDFHHVAPENGLCENVFRPRYFAQSMLRFVRFICFKMWQEFLANSDALIVLCKCTN